MAVKGTTSLRDDFIAWQCRVRQLAARQNAGQPLPGMLPRVLDAAGNELSPGIVTLLARRAPAESTAAFRFAFQRTQDPRNRYASALEMLAGTYLQNPHDFSGVLTALFAPGSRLATRLVAQGTCILEFAAFEQGIVMPCRVAQLARADAHWQATYWHNHLFNPALPLDPTVLSFAPDWRKATAAA